MIKITWSAGHGKFTSGKQTPDGKKEWTFNDAVVRAGISYLSQFEGVAQLRLDDPTGQRDIPLAERSSRANSWGTNLHLDVHQNAQDDKWDDVGFGTETYVMQGTKHYPESLKAAKLIHKHLVQATGLKDRGIKSSNLHMLREIKAPSVLTEGAFMDSREDVKVLNSAAELKEQGEAIAKGIVEYFGLKKKEGTKVDNIKLTSGQQNAVDKLVKHGMLQEGFEFPNDTNGQVTLTLVTILAPLVTKLEKKGSI
jgi:N-acetylmuramoyl-L-alanine amidase